MDRPSVCMTFSLGVFCVTMLINFTIYTQSMHLVPVPVSRPVFVRNLEDKSEIPPPAPTVPKQPPTVPKQPPTVPKQPPTVPKPPPCKPVHRIVYVKTHKTAGTTLATIIQRYGYTRNLTFAIPARDTPVFNAYRHFKSGAVFQYANHPRKVEWGQVSAKFDMMVNHAVYNRPEMEATVPEAVYLTSLRDPVDQFESAFVFFDMAKQAKIKSTNTNSSTSDPISEFLNNHETLRKRVYYGRAQVQNGQLYDLGLLRNNFQNPFEIKYKISQLDREFDLVLISEYFDESLILMKKLLCWDMDDILYIRKRMRQSEYRTQMSDNLRRRIRSWNRADVMLYEHFNRTLWRKIDDYGLEFWRELQEFRDRVSEITSTCNNTDNNEVVRDEVHHIDIVRMKNGSQLCRELSWYDGDYTKLIRQRMISQTPPEKKTEAKTETKIKTKSNTNSNSIPKKTVVQSGIVQKPKTAETNIPTIRLRKTVNGTKPVVAQRRVLKRIIKKRPPRRVKW